MNAFNNISFLKVLFRWKWHLTVVVGAAILLGTIFSAEWIVKPKYKSSAVLYPANLTPYGNETATEQMLQLLQSADIRTAICERFNLADHYNINLAKKGAQSVLFDQYNENVDIRRTEFESVKIDVYDTDPNQACLIVNAIMELMNLKARALQRSKTTEVVKLLKDELDFKHAQIDSLETALRVLREKYGLLDYYIQSKEALKRYYKLITSGNVSADKLRTLDTIMKNLEDKGAESVSLKQIHQKSFETYSEIRAQYDKALSDSRKVLTYANVVTTPIPADRKSSPIRWFVICISAFSSFAFALLVIIVFENKERFIKPE